MRFIHVAAIAVLLVVPSVLVAGSAHADNGIEGYARCIGGGAQPPPPGVRPENWFPSVHVIETDMDGAVPPAQIVERLVVMGVNRPDAVRQVQCFMAYEPRG
ncbi:hypothetical protein BRW65_05400 [Mycobacterium paraffinicum]|uniref:DUF732 domain-containing protein n=1 Tax=Mycobacterium paraffinicum TaxID=53378 RepID=A0A1Q4I030_9MYCO|nr:hypothetical protein [Mycobacterium paraffinicum]OJZ75248.1 hypothetical protein BRW65_05400 [Mycobacterium paraffinicum]